MATIRETFEIEKEFRLLLRTRDLSPPIIEILSFAFGATAFGWQVFGAIRSKIDAWRERKEIYYSLFGFSLNADFITNNPPEEELRKGTWAITDLYAAEEAVGFLLKGFAQKPEVKLEGKGQPGPDFRRNIVSLGGPCNNRFSRWIMKAKDSNGLEEPPSNLNLTLEDLPELPFNFGYDLEESRDLTWEQRKTLRMNWPIKKMKGKTIIYTPEIYYGSDNRRVCKRDYGMIVKVRSLHREGRQEGRWNLMLAGCHGAGSLGAAKALGDEDILEQIWREVKTKEFQAVLAVEVETEEEKAEIQGKKQKIKIDVAKRVELIEIESL